ncbi:MAG: carnosine N-methyltransferase family protein [Nannocystaceae bacterium]|nr:carnosine N-methyltransferase family protein [Nannocystaceae bacterium]
MAWAEACQACPECNRPGLLIDDIPVLTSDPAAMVRDWGTQRAEFSREIGATRDLVLAQLAGQALPQTTRGRLQHLYESLQRHHDEVASLYESAAVPVFEAPLLRGGRVPGEGTATAYFDQIHRDWGWGTGEPEAALEIVLDVLGDRRPKRMLVLGAGACRLPYELHCAASIETTVALDINPLPFFVARRVMAGETVALTEFPRCPRHSHSVAVGRELRNSDAGVGGFHLLFADGLDPPVPDGSFDLVLTPWFIDQVPKDLATLVPTISRILREGGAWLNHGPLLYQPSHTQPAHRYREDEVHELTEAAGFLLARHRWDRLLYMESPDGSQGRTEGISTFLAEKRERPASARNADEAPLWLDDASLAVPRWRGLDDYQAPHPMFAAVASLIDGRRSAQAVADEMVSRFNLPADAALGGVMTCLAEMWRARRSE